MKKVLVEPPRFSEHFRLSTKSGDLDFLDIYANQDIQLFLDPYGISAMGTSWSRKCELHITGFFQYLVDSIKVGDKKAIKTLLNALHEVDEVALGYSTGKPSGRGIGNVQAVEIQAAFESSQAAKSPSLERWLPPIMRQTLLFLTATLLTLHVYSQTQEDEAFKMLNDTRR